MRIIYRAKIGTMQFSIVYFRFSLQSNERCLLFFVFFFSFLFRSKIVTVPKTVSATICRFLGIRNCELGAENMTGINGCACSAQTNAQFGVPFSDLMTRKEINSRYIYRISFDGAHFYFHCASANAKRRQK